ncbi:MAG TPA: hypothetical protein VFE62_24615, partial [Gemmataceae bacterium]|nr:hypothetical protein [Gemmataceae bacterium]
DANREVGAAGNEDGLFGEFAKGDGVCARDIGAIASAARSATPQVMQIRYPAMSHTPSMDANFPVRPSGIRKHRQERINANNLSARPAGGDI